MPAVCWFYGYTPAQFRALTVREWRALVDFMRASLSDKGDE